MLLSKVNEQGYETLDARFLDWPSSTNEKGIDAGLQAIMAMAMDCGAKMATLWGNEALAQKCSQTAEKMKKCRRDCNGS